jgi:hypothetical protein
MYEDVWRMNPNNLQRYTKGYGYGVANGNSAAVPVLTQSGTGIKYSVVPESIHPFQDSASGVRRISTIAQGGFTFFPIDFREMDLIASGSYSKTINSKVGYAVKRTNIEYYGITSAIQDEGVRMDLIIPFSKYEEDEEVKIPEISDTRTGETFTDRALKILGVIRPVDLRDDNSASPEMVQRDN